MGGSTRRGLDFREMPAKRRHHGLKSGVPAANWLDKHGFSRIFQWFLEFCGLLFRFCRF
jgi:hypothetical protein